MPWLARSCDVRVLMLAPPARSPARARGAGVSVVMSSMLNPGMVPGSSAVVVGAARALRSLEARRRSLARATPSLPRARSTRDAVWPRPVAVASTRWLFRRYTTCAAHGLPELAPSSPCSLVCVVAAPAVGQTAAATGKIPITTSSEEARAAVSEGPRSRREAARHRCAPLLRAGRGQGSRLRARLRRAGQHLRHQSRVRRGGDEGGRPRVEGERRRTAHGARARGGAQERPRGRAAALHRARGALSERRARADAAGEHLLRPAGVSDRDRSLREGDRDQRDVLAAVQPAGLCLPVPRTSTGRRRPRSRSTSSSFPTIRTRTTRMPSSS